VITGVIKANFPSRIAFQVASKTDSRTVLDMNGAENLLGLGDMLFTPTGRPEPYRVHGAFVSEEETAKVVEFWKLRAVPGAPPPPRPLRVRVTRAPRRAERGPAAPPALAFVTLGCPKNTVDSESMLGLLVRDGFRTVGDPFEADIAVVNTCAFLTSAVRESKQAIAEVAECRRAGKLKGLIVAGCLAQRAG